MEEVVLRPDSRENPVHYSNVRSFSRHKRTTLCEYSYQSCLPKQSGFASHIGSSDDVQSGFGREGYRVRYEIAPGGEEAKFYRGMATVGDMVSDPGDEGPVSHGKQSCREVIRTLL